MSGKIVCNRASQKRGENFFLRYGNQKIWKMRVCQAGSPFCTYFPFAQQTESYTTDIQFDSICLPSRIDRFVYGSFGILLGFCQQNKDKVGMILLYGKYWPWLRKDWWRQCQHMQRRRRTAYYTFYGLRYKYNMKHEIKIFRPIVLYWSRVCLDPGSGDDLHFRQRRHHYQDRGSRYISLKEVQSRFSTSWDPN